LVSSSVLFSRFCKVRVSLLGSGNRYGAHGTCRKDTWDADKAPDKAYEMQECGPTGISPFEALNEVPVSVCVKNLSQTRACAGRQPKGVHERRAAVATALQCTYLLGIGCGAVVRTATAHCVHRRVPEQSGRQLGRRMYAVLFDGVCGNE
jgi:hypothetical protein